MLTYRPLIAPFLLTLLCLAILISLGQWQLARLDWKLGLIERIETRAASEPISLERARQLWRENGDVEYYRVTLTGRFAHAHERHLYGLVNGQAGWRILTPLQTGGGDIIFVDRGFVPEPFRDPATRSDGQIEGQITLVGLARASEEGSFFTPENQPAANRWFLRDVDALNASLPEPLASRSAPFMVEAEAMNVPGGWPRAGVTRLGLSNRHLEYALTWFGLAASLAGVFGVYAWQKLRKVPARGANDANVADKKNSV